MLSLLSNDFVELDNFANDRIDVLTSRIHNPNIIVLIDAVFDLNIARLNAILQTEKRIIDEELFHVCRYQTSLQIMDAQEVICKMNRIGCAIAVL